MSTIVDEFLLIDMVYEVYKNYLMSTVVDRHRPTQYRL